MKFESDAFWPHGYRDFGGLNGGFRPDRPPHPILRGQTLLAARDQRILPYSCGSIALRIAKDRDIPGLQDLRGRL